MCIRDRSLFVEGRGHDFGLDVASHFGYLLRTLVDQQYDHIDFRMVVGDGVGDRLHEHRFTGLGLGDDQGALPLADRREEIHLSLIHICWRGRWKEW